MWRYRIEKLKRAPLRWKLLFGGQFVITMYLIGNRINENVTVTEQRKLLEAELAKRGGA